MSTPKQPSPFRSYEDLLFDLCHSTLTDAQSAQQIFETIIKELAKTKISERYKNHERSWVFKIACQQILRVHSRNEIQPTCSAQIELDSLSSSASRLKHFAEYFQRLQPEDRLLILIRDKYGLPFSELASTFNVSEESLKARRNRILRTLEKWVWSDK